MAIARLVADFLLRLLADAPLCCEAAFGARFGLGKADAREERVMVFWIE